MMDLEQHPMSENTIEDPRQMPAPQQIEKMIEAILFAAGHPISYAKLAEVIGVSVKEIKHITEEMKQKYDDAASIGGIMLLTFEKECQLCTRPEMEAVIREALDIKKGGNLSASSLEVLAIIAYNEPTTRSFVDTVRGVDSSYALNRLCERGLIENCGRLDVPGRPLLYRTTASFLRCFGLSSLAELPNVSLPNIADPAQNTSEEPASH